MSVTSPIAAWSQLPAGADLLDRSQVLRADDRDHPLLALGDHDLPRLHVLLAQRNAVEVDVDPAVASRAISASDEASPAAPQSWSDSTRPRSTSSRLDSISFLPVNGSPICTDGPLVGVVLAELLAREHARAADPVAAGRRAVEDDDVAGAARLRA